MRLPVTIHDSEKNQDVAQGLDPHPPLSPRKRGNKRGKVDGNIT